MDIGIFLCFLELCFAKNSISFEKELLVEKDHELEKNLLAIYKLKK